MIHWQDGVNGFYEALGGLTNYYNCYRLYRDKQVKGVSVAAFAFFASWGVWNLYYYPSLRQWMSFTGGLVIVSANILWVTLALVYRRQ